ncbi:MAG: DUF4159 domain-containing protein [Boseongicola sp.]|nr:MAG: DUF4159 domain-containing protein [Boseongicola sp.]
MWSIGPIGFTAPWLLLGLVLLPILWLLLRAVPPAPIRRRFPGVALLLGLTDDETQTDRTPWWLLLIRTLAIAAAIIGFAGPVLNPKAEQVGSGPLLVLIDGTWADASDWSARMDRAGAALNEAAQAGREVALAVLTDLPPGELVFRTGDALVADLLGLEPKAWSPNAEEVAGWSAALEGGFDTLWLSDGLDWDWRAPLLDVLQEKGAVSVFEASRSVFGLKPARFEDGSIVIEAVRSRVGDAAGIDVSAFGLDPTGIERQLASLPLTFFLDAAAAEGELSLPPELRNRITRFEIDGRRSAGAVTLTDDALRRREVAILSARDEREGLQLLSPTHYLEQALIPNAELISGAIPDLVLANPDVIVLADIASLAGNEPDLLEDWVRDGGILLRFAGPRLAASDIGREAEDTLMPVRLRAGGRSVGGAMSWGEPKELRAFGPDSPFFGLAVPQDVRVSAQVMAQPDPTLSERTIATLADGTPLVTRKRMDAGQIVLFHVTANAEWSTLPLSGLFVQMLERLSISARPSQITAEDLTGTTWTPNRILTAGGLIEDAGNLPGVAGEDLAEAPLSADLQPGLYSGEDRRIARNVITPDTTLAATTWPAEVPVEGLGFIRDMPLKGLVLTLAMLALMADIIASLWLSGRLIGPRAQTAGLLLATLIALPHHAQAQTSDDDLAKALAAASEVTLAYIITGNSRIDQASEAGLSGLSRMLFRRTSIEPANPTAVNLETDELAVYPFLYWAVTPDQPRPSGTAYEKLNRYLRTGGMILFDTRDSDTARFGGGSPNGQKLQDLALPLDIPPLEPIPSDHVLTRTFYLLQDFPGRHAGRDVWVEAAPADAEQAEGMPFRNLNDNVTPVIIGGNDWAAAWAMDANNVPMFPVGRGFAGERHREIAYRFGINLIMHVLTGNYKSDQVHVPALLDRLGQ